MTGYYEPGKNFSVELYKRDVIMRAVLPDDLPAQGNPWAMERVAEWRRRNREKWEALQEQA